ncbi:MAG: TolC family protein [Oscillatoria sp. PMC 1068.18]|nr:TolC family protein [Oscillatoria sp. PMC 1076.18]MEC4990409.1 TolC family protein [Oscillatoria sp. PMC 1068.18]
MLAFRHLMAVSSAVIALGYGLSTDTQALRSLHKSKTDSNFFSSPKFVGKRLNSELETGGESETVLLPMPLGYQPSANLFLADESSASPAPLSSESGFLTLDSLPGKFNIEKEIQRASISNSGEAVFVPRAFPSPSERQGITDLELSNFAEAKETKETKTVAEAFVLPPGVNETQTEAFFPSPYDEDVFAQSPQNSAATLSESEFLLAAPSELNNQAIASESLGKPQIEEFPTPDNHLAIPSNSPAVTSLSEFISPENRQTQSGNQRSEANNQAIATQTQFVGKFVPLTSATNSQENTASPQRVARLLTQQPNVETLPPKLPQLNNRVVPQNPPPSAPISPGTRLPEELQPSSNPLLFPTRTNEVQIDRLQPISLTQAIQLARRNNRELQVARLNLARAKESLQEVLATEYPSLTTQVDFTRTESATGELQLDQQFLNIDRQIEGIQTQQRQVESQINDVGDQINDVTDQITNLDPLAPDFPQQQAQLQQQQAQLQQQQTQLQQQQNQLQQQQNNTEASRPIRDSTSTSLDARLQLSYNLYTGGRRPAQIKAAEEQVRLNQLEVERVAEQIRFDTTSDYYDLQNADAQVAIAEGAVEEAQESLEDANLLERAGLGTRFDVLRAQVDLANAQQDLTLAISSQLVARRQLVQRLSLAQGVELVAADPVEVAGSWDLSLEETILLAYQNRAELQQQLAQREIDAQQRQIELAAIKPQVSLFANYNILGVLDDELDPGDGFQLGARLQWTLFDGGAARARAEQEKIDGAIAETNFADQRNIVRFEVERSYYNLLANQENIQTANVAVELAKESLRLARLRFQAGVGTQTDVIAAQSELTTARGNLLRAIIDYNTALAALQRAVSNLPDSNLFDLP